MRWLPVAAKTVRLLFKIQIAALEAECKASVERFERGPAHLSDSLCLPTCEAHFAAVSRRWRRRRHHSLTSRLTGLCVHRSKAVSGRGLAGVLQDGLLPPRVQPRRLQGGRAGVPRGWRTPRQHTHAARTEAHPDAPGGRRRRRRPARIIRHHRPHHVQHRHRLPPRHQSPHRHHHPLGHRPHPSWELCVVQKLRLGSRISDGDFWIGLRRADDDGVAPCPQRYRWTDGSAAAFR